MKNKVKNICKKRNEKMIILSLKNKNFYVAMDFDKTITSSDSVDSWAAVAQAEFVGQELGKKMDELYNKYRPIEVDYSISEDEKKKYIEEWYKSCMN